MKDEELICLCALRYAIGRRTYITGVVADYLLTKIHLLSDTCRQQIIKEIQEADDLGGGCDKEAWENLLKKAIEVTPL
jgi:hypothetical protein